MKIILFLLSIVSLIVGCGNQDNRNNEERHKREIVSIDSITLRTIEKASTFNDLFVQGKVINLETTTESLVGVIEQIIYLPKEQRIIVLDSKVAKSILVFNLEGKFLYKIGKSGKGPQEFTSPSTIAYNNKRLAVFSDEQFKLLFYNLDGSFIKEISLPGERWNFYIEKMYLWNNDLYAYNNNEYYSKGPDGKKYRVFRIKNCNHFDSAYGTMEKTLDFGDGNIILFNNRIIFSSIFDGNIYQILPEENKSSIFSSLGVLTDLSEYKNLSDLLKNIKKIDSIISLGVIENVLFVRCHYDVSIIDDSGKMLKRLPLRLMLPDGFEGFALRTGFVFHDNGIIIASNDKSRITETEIPNPSLIIYYFNK